MHGTEELEFDVRAEPALRELETGQPEVVSGRIRAKVYGGGPAAQIQGRRLLTRAERANPQGCTDLPLGPVQKATDRRIQREPRADGNHELPADAIHVERPIHHVARDVRTESDRGKRVLTEHGQDRRGAESCDDDQSLSHRCLGGWVQADTLILPEGYTLPRQRA